MLYKFSYDFPEAKTVSLVGDFNNWDKSVNVMERDENGKWEAYVELQPGRYRYKYFIDGLYKLNDPYANLYIPVDNGEMLSLIIIDDKGEILVNNQQYSMQLDRYVLWDKQDSIPEQQGKKSFLESSEKIFCLLEFSKVTGVHSVAAVWYAPDMKYYHMAETFQWTPEGKEGEPLELNFFINVREQKIPTGNWILRIYINGGFVFEDNFIIKPISYSTKSLYSIRA